MATNPSATTSVSATAGASGAGTDILCLVMPCKTNADMVPRLFSSARTVFEQHGYCEGVEYVELHAKRTGKAVLVAGVPIETPGAISREDTSGNTDDCVTTVTAGADGVLTEHDGVLTVITGGTIGTDPIVLGLSLDGGRTTKRVRLGTATSYVIPYVEVTIAFAAGDLTAGETIHTWHGSAPLLLSSNLDTVRTNLAAQQKSFRTALLIGDVQTDDEAADWQAIWDTYETSDKRFVNGRCSAYDREPQAALSVTTWRKSSLGTLTFDDNVGGDTCTRSAGSWITDGFAVGDYVTFSGTVSNNVSGKITTLTDTVMGFGVVVLFADEGPVVGAACVGQASIVFANGGDTITRSRGSWFTDGFRDADTVTIAGTAGTTNDGTFVIDALTATVMTLAAGGVDADETAGANMQTIVTGQTKAAWMTELEAALESIDDAERCNIGAGRLRVRSTESFTGWRFRRPVQWFATARQFQHDLHIPTWRKSDGDLDADLYDADGNLAEWDDRVDGGAGTAARFTTATSWANGPDGAFIAQDLTRATDGSILSKQQNADVTNLGCKTVQKATEDACIGRVMVLNDDGTAASDEIKTVEGEVNRQLETALLKNSKGEGQRASKAVWTASTDDDMSIAEPIMTGVLELLLNGTVHSVVTRVRVNSGS